MVGASGFEPPTPCTPCRCANQAALRPDKEPPEGGPTSVRGSRPRGPPSTCTRPARERPGYSVRDYAAFRGCCQGRCRLRHAACVILGGVTVDSDTLFSCRFSPSGARGCSRGWNVAAAWRPDAEPVERGWGEAVGVLSPLFAPAGRRRLPSGRTDAHARRVLRPLGADRRGWGPPPPDRFHGLRVARLAAGRAPPAATSRGPDGAEKPRRAPARPVRAAPIRNPRSAIPPEVVSKPLVHGLRASRGTRKQPRGRF